MSVIGTQDLLQKHITCSLNQIIVVVKISFANESHNIEMFK